MSRVNKLDQLTDHNLALTSANKATDSDGQQVGPENSSLARLKRYSGRVVVSSLLGTTLLLGACGNDSANDCIPTSPPPAAVAPPGSSGFTASTPSTNSGTYCKSRSTGGYYYYGGSRGSSYSGGSSSS